MRIRNFPSCHCHIASLDSASTPESFVKRELELGTGVLVTTDHGSLGACRKVYDLAKANKLTPVLGLEGYLRDESCSILTAAGYPKNERGAFTTAPKYEHITMHFLDQDAYECGVRLLSKADERLEEHLAMMEPDDRKHGSERKPLFTWDDLEELGGHNVTMTTGCMIGIISRHMLDNNDPRVAKAYFAKLKSITKPGNLYTELNPHDTSKNWVEGIFLTMADGSKQRFYKDKVLLTDVGEITAVGLARNWAAGKHKILKSVKDRTKWREMPEQKIVDVQHVEDYLPNSGCSWAPNGDLQAGLNRMLKIWAKEFGVKVIVGDDSHYATPDEQVVQDVRLSQGGSWKFFGSYSRKSSEEALAHFKKTLGTTDSEFEGWVDNSYEWADRFKGFVFNTPVSIPTKFYEPEYALQPWFKGEDKDNSVKYTMYLIKKHGRMDWTNKVWIDRLRAEINLLHSNGVVDLLPYFFLDEEVCALYEKNGLLTGPGRGSAAGLLLTYLLGITHVDPIKYNLSMDRFLTKDRIASGKYPDIDQDLGNRDLLLNPDTGWLKQRFGDCVAQISVDTKLKVASAVKDVARTTHQRCDTCAKIHPTVSSCCGRTTRGFVPPEIEAWTKKFMKPPQGVNDYDFVMGYDADEGRMQGSIEYDPALQDYVRANPKDWEIVKKCLGLTRQKSIHPCGFLIANRPISEFVPLTTISDVRVTSYTAESVEAVGGLKMDFLTVNVLQDIQHAIAMIQRRSRYKADAFREQFIDGKLVPGHRVVPAPVLTPVPFDPDTTVAFKLCDIWDLPEDQDVFAEIATGRTETVFQFDTPGAIQWLAHFAHKKPSGNYAIDSIESMAYFTALDRPGPLDARVVNPEDGSKHNMLVEYARRARGAEASRDILPIFDELLPHMHGIMITQEAMQYMYQNLTGCTGSEAEEFRSNVAKKKMTKVEKAYLPFVETASIKIGRENAEAVWKNFLTFGQYGFNMSHAVCYSFTAYACAWLKHHYPLEWWTAVLGNAKKTEVAEKFWRHCGHLVDLPDVKLSGGSFEIQGARIRAPISLLQGVGEVAHNQVMKYSPYTDIDDFCQKIEKHRVDTGVNVQKMKKEKIKETKRRDETTKKWIYDEREVEVTVFKKGYSAINRGIVKTLILSGAMDSLFPPEMHVGEQMVDFERALATASGAKKPAKVDPKDWDFDPIQRYQTRKAILPVYGADLVEMFLRMQVVPDLNIDQISGKPTFSYVSSHNGKWNTIGVVGIETLEECMNTDMGAEQSITLAVAAHIDDARVFRYGEERREACELMLDVDGSKVKFVKWAGKAIDLPEEFKQPLKGAVAMVVLNKYKADRPFAVDGLVVVRPPLSEVAEEEPNEEGEPNVKPNDSSSPE